MEQVVDELPLMIFKLERFTQSLKVGDPSISALTNPVLRSRSLQFWGGSGADFFGRSEPRAGDGAAFFMAAPAPTGSFRIAKMMSLALVIWNQFNL